MTSYSSKWYCLHFNKDCLNCIHELFRPQSLLSWQLLTFTCQTHGNRFTCLYSSHNQWSLVIRIQIQRFECNSSHNIANWSKIQFMPNIAMHLSNKIKWFWGTTWTWKLYPKWLQFSDGLASLQPIFLAFVVCHLMIKWFNEYKLVNCISQHWFSEVPYSIQ